MPTVWAEPILELNYGSGWALASRVPRAEYPAKTKVWLPAAHGLQQCLFAVHRPIAVFHPASRRHGAHTEMLQLYADVNV